MKITLLFLKLVMIGVALLFVTSLSAQTTRTTQTTKKAQLTQTIQTVQMSNQVKCLAIEPGTLCTDVEPFCGDDCDNSQYCATTCWTTSEGPPWSGGGATTSTAILYCSEGTYANCHYSGPPWPTGTNPDNIPLS